jgi:hypothetical protein
MNPLYTAHQGNNADLIKAVSDFYIEDDALVADVTYGKGAFWNSTDTTRFKFKPSDLVTCPKKSQHDFRNLPYKTGKYDHVIFDPPYMHNAGKPMVEDRYQNAATTKGMYHDDILILYAQGMREARRILRMEGLLWVKCKDEIESSQQRMSVVEIHDIAVRILRMTVKDFFVLMPTSTPPIQHKRQNHARKNHSYLWLFQK